MIGVESRCYLIEVSSVKSFVGLRSSFFTNFLFYEPCVHGMNVTNRRDST